MMSRWIDSQGALELVEPDSPIPALRLLATIEGSFTTLLPEGETSIAGDKALLLRDALPPVIIPSYGCKLIHIALRPGTVQNGMLSPADMYRAYSDYRAFCALEADRFVFHDKQAHVINAYSILGIYAKYDGRERELLIACELNALLLYAAQACVHPGESMPLGNRYVRAAMQFMRDNYMSDITTEDVARAAGVHVSHLHRLFAEQAGAQPGQYLTELRMEKARFLLTRTNLSMLSIAKLCGIASQQYFSRCFKRQVGITPQEYRRTYAVTCDYYGTSTDSEVYEV